MATVPIGTSSIAPKSSEKGLTLTAIHCLKDIVLQLAPAHIVSAWESNSLVSSDTAGCCEACPIFLLEID